MGEGKTSSTLVSASSDGNLYYWQATTGKCLSKIKNDNFADLYCVDFNKEGTLVATGGRDNQVKIYDDSSKTLVSTLKISTASSLGHSNRVFSVRFTNDRNVLVSGGWDNTIFIWDIREARSVGYMYGPHICGDSIDVRGDELLTGSYSNKDMLQLWSIKERKLTTTIPWEVAGGTDTKQGYLYAASFDKSYMPPRYIVAGGAGSNELRLFRNEKDYDMLARIGFSKTVTSIDFAYSKSLIATGSSDGYMRIYAFEDSAF